MLCRRKACASELNASLLERFTTSAAKFRRKQTALTRAVLLISNKRSTLCMLSLVFVAKCSHKLGELPAGVRGMYIVAFYFFSILFLSTFWRPKSCKKPRHTGKPVCRLFVCESQATSLSRAGIASLAFSLCCRVLRNLICAAIQENIYPRKSSNSSHTMACNRGGLRSVFQRCRFLFDVTFVRGNVKNVSFFISSVTSWVGPSGLLW